MSIRSFRSAMSFLTVIPIASADGGPGERLGRAYFPAVGAIVGLAAGALYAVVAPFTTPFIAAVASVAVLALVTGGLHLDGVADSADGLFGKGDVARRLEVMRDPRVGSYGVAALVLVLAGEVAAISALTPRAAIVALVAAGALSRLAMLATVAFVPYVRAAGLGVAAAGTHRIFDLALGGVITACVCFLDPRHALIAAALTGLATTAIVVLARRRIGGATGDVYGAVAEVGLLASLVAFTLHR